MRLGLFIGGIVLVILVSVCVQRYSFLVRTGFSLVWHILTATARNVGLVAAGAQLIAFRANCFLATQLLAVETDGAELEARAVDVAATLATNGCWGGAALVHIGFGKKRERTADPSLPQCTMG